MNVYPNTISGIAEWLVDTGFPFDWKTDKEPPAALLQRVCELWADRDGESYGDYAICIADETGWDVRPQEKGEPQ